jgi:FkbM family methyltransferase
VNWYGQFNTDEIIAGFFPDGYIGSAVEVGASHGTVSSNTYHFELNGWLCLCIEPNPGLFAALKNNRKHVLPYAVDMVNADDIPFTVITLSNGDTTAISGLQIDERLIETHPVIKRETILVPTRTLDTCLDEFGQFDHIDFISIDTEGTEYNVLRGFDIDRWNPILLVIENNFDEPRIANYLEGFGYKRIRRYVINDFYTR